ncbi:MAG: DtxR family transcriptional regulator [Xylanivirga thermophila]|jgi:DtxR family transcriptional regulator, Mn-dependent transcriptional regulator|uniref:metal-dependent transcriptional regulator n=1 Tax=Xylanivirga thermophila TaxID=2496273 RepID=UPI001A91D5EE|nr:iron dependent repressor, metal binding and dimerization domain protein [Xylanivirga thermophila]
MVNNDEFYTVRGYEILKQEKEVLTSSMEDYLEMIYRYYEKEGYIRINILADLLNVQASSATKVVQKLSSVGLVDYQKYGAVKLTERGEEIGSFLLKRHKAIEIFLKNLGVEENILMDTEMIEHGISVETLNSILLFNQFFDQHPEIVDLYYEFRKKNNIPLSGDAFIL